MYLHCGTVYVLNRQIGFAVLRSAVRKTKARCGSRRDPACPLQLHVDVLVPLRRVGSLHQVFPLGSPLATDHSRLYELAKFGSRSWETTQSQSTATLKENKFQDLLARPELTG